MTIALVGKNPIDWTRPDGCPAGFEPRHAQPVREPLPTDRPEGAAGLFTGGLGRAPKAASERLWNNPEAHRVAGRDNDGFRGGDGASRRL